MSKKKNGCCIECDEKIHSKSIRCNGCANKESKRKYIDVNELDKIADLVVTNNTFVCTRSFAAYEKIDNRIAAIPVKRKFMFPCLGCTKEYETILQREKKKQHKWHCASCAAVLMWKSPDYHKRHVESIIIAKSTPESIERHSIATKKKWSNPEYREATLTSLRKVWRSQEYRSRISASLKHRWLTNPPDCSSRRYNIQVALGQIILKSSYERDFVRFLESRGYSWEYETRRYLLKSLDRSILIPDFYIKELDLVVEIKGYFWGDAKQKWDAFATEYPDVKKLILFKDDLQLLTIGEKKLEDYLKKSCGEEESL